VSGNVIRDFKLHVEPNPTWAWEENAALPLTVDLDEHRLCGIAAGDSVEKLSILGPGKVTPFGFAWPRKGVDVTVSDDGSIEEMGFYFGHAAEARNGEFVGSFQYCGRPLRLSKELSESDIHSLFGKPYWRDQDEDEIILFYEFPNCEWQLELDLDGFLKYLRIGSQLLADAEQRVAYAVTKPWPPYYS
jgi:hypothetical protein